jgi:hypothetical protein
VGFLDVAAHDDIRFLELLGAKLEDVEIGDPCALLPVVLVPFVGAALEVQLRLRLDDTGLFVEFVEGVGVHPLLLLMAVAFALLYMLLVPLVQDHLVMLLGVGIARLPPPQSAPP